MLLVSMTNCRVLLFVAKLSSNHIHSRRVLMIGAEILFCYRALIRRSRAVQELYCARTNLRGSNRQHVVKRGALQIQGSMSKFVARAKGLRLGGSMVKL